LPSLSVLVDSVAMDSGIEGGVLSMLTDTPLGNKGGAGTTIQNRLASLRK
jgi:hypothetical protein